LARWKQNVEDVWNYTKIEFKKENEQRIEDAKWDLGWH